LRFHHLSQLATAVALSWVGSPATASAQSADAAASETLFRDGKRLLDQKDFAHACPKLAESFHLEPATGTLLALAMCHEGDGKVATAWAEYTDAAARARREGRPDREQAALQWAGVLEPNLSTRTISVPDAVAKTSGLEIKRDGVAVGAAAWGTAVPVDPGEHLIEVTATGKRTWTKSVAIRTTALGEKLAIVPLEDLPAAPAPAPEVGNRGLSALQQTALVFGAVGIVGLGVGSFFGIQAFQKNNESNQGCTGDQCDTAARQTRLEARSSGSVSTVAFIGGGAFLIGGAVMYFAGASGGPRHGAIRAVPSAGRSEVGLLVSGSI